MVGKGVAIGRSTSMGEYGCTSSSHISVGQGAETRHELGPGCKPRGLPHINSLLLVMPHLLKLSQLPSSPQRVELFKCVNQWEWEHFVSKL